MNPKLIVALDFDTENDAFHLIDKLDPQNCGLKVGSEMYTRFGAHFVKQLISRQFKVFLDLKFHDIPNTVAQACKAAADLGVWMMNVHALGGFTMMKAAHEALESYGKERPILIAVTVLTSFTDSDLLHIGIPGQLIEQVKRLARLALSAGLDGVVSSAYEVKTIKEECGSGFLTVTPGIRLLNDSKDDQSRIMTPRQAIDEGSDYLVIGRSITKSIDPAKVVLNVLSDLS